MEAIVLTVAVAAVAVIGYVVASRTWPRSSGLGGYRARLEGDRDGSSDGPTAPGVHEDDDARWNWARDHGGTRDDDGPGDRGDPGEVEGR